MLFLYQHNFAELSLNALYVPLAAAIVLALLVWVIVWLFVRERERAALITSALMILTFSYGPSYNLLENEGRVIPNWPVWFSVLWFFLSIFVIFLLSRSRTPVKPLSDAINIAGITLTAFLLVSNIRGEIVRAAQVKKFEHEYVTNNMTPRETKNLPDIYYFILDSYARADVLQDIFRYDNRAFINGLKKRGFYIANKSYSNYSFTVVSIPSSLNMTHMQAVAQKAGTENGDRAPLRQMIHDNQVRHVLKEHGYTIVDFPSEYSAIEMPCDVVDIPSMGGVPDFYSAVMNYTPLRLLALESQSTTFDPYAAHRRNLLWQFAHVPDAAKVPGPKFVFAHFLAPHPPLVFDAQGRAVAADVNMALQRGRHWRSKGEMQSDYTERYREELQYINKRVLGMIDKILAHSERDVVMVIQGDHGPGYLPDYPDPDGICIPERFGILNAYRMPKGGARRLYPTITPVNSFRVIFSYYLHHEYPLLEDRSYFSGFLFPYHFTEVTDILRKAKRPYPRPQTEENGTD